MGYCKGNEYFTYNNQPMEEPVYYPPQTLIANDSGSEDLVSLGVW